MVLCRAVAGDRRLAAHCMAKSTHSLLRFALKRSEVCPVLISRSKRSSKAGKTRSKPCCHTSHSLLFRGGRQRRDNIIPLAISMLAIVSKKRTRFGPLSCSCFCSHDRRTRPAHHHPNRIARDWRAIVERDRDCETQKWNGMGSLELDPLVPRP